MATRPLPLDRKWIVPPTEAVKGILRADGLRLLRDRFLVGMSVYILAISVAMRWIIPFVTSELQRRLQFDFTPYHPLLVSHVLIQLAPLLGGMIGGFLILESKETRTVKAFSVSPVSLTGYVLVLGTVILVGAALLTVLEGLLIGIAVPSIAILFATGLAGAPAGVAIALFIGTVATTKTEAFAYAKFVGAAPVLASAAWFVPEPWQYIAAVYPPYWASKAYWTAIAGHSHWPVLVVVGLSLSAVWLVLMTKLCVRALRRH